MNDLQGLIAAIDEEIKDTLQIGQAAGGAYYAGRHSGLLWVRHQVALIESDHQSSQVQALVGAALAMCQWFLDGRNGRPPFERLYDALVEVDDE